MAKTISSEDAKLGAEHHRRGRRGKHHHQQKQRQQRQRQEQVGQRISDAVEPAEIAGQHPDERAEHRSRPTSPPAPPPARPARRAASGQHVAANLVGAQRVRPGGPWLRFRIILRGVGSTGCQSSGPITTSKDKDRQHDQPDQRALVMCGTGPRHHSLRGGSITAAFGVEAVSVIADPRVEQAIEDVGDQVEEHDQHRQR
jgi:hypothetical protein